MIQTNTNYLQNYMVSSSRLFSTFNEYNNKMMNHKCDGDSDRCWSHWKSLKEELMETARFKEQRKKRNHQDYSPAKISGCVQER